MSTAELKHLVTRLRHSVSRELVNGVLTDTDVNLRAAEAIEQYLNTLLGDEKYVD